MFLTQADESAEHESEQEQGWLPEKKITPDVDDYDETGHEIEQRVLAPAFPGREIN